MTQPVFLRETLRHRTLGPVTLLAALSTPTDTGQGFRLFFRSGDALQHFQPGLGVRFDAVRTLGDAPYLTGSHDGQLTLTVAGELAEIDPVLPDLTLFEGLDTLLATHNGEPPETLRDWLQFHVETQGTTGAIILTRGRPTANDPLAKDLADIARQLPGLRRLLLLEADLPLGQPDLPPEAHPVNVPGAPGKDRMEIPPPDPWQAPLGDVILYEYIRHRWLDRARAVANIDTYDLLLPQKTTVFDRAVNSATGAITLAGQQVYPWRLRPDTPPSFGDHICRQFDASSLRRRWCVAPAKAGPDSVWRMIRVVGTAPGKREVAGFIRCMSLRHDHPNVSKIVPKTSLIEDEGLLALHIRYFNATPERVPAEEVIKSDPNARKTAIVTTMKNEGPFILEWLAYHRAIGVQDFLIYTNDCTDGTDTMLQMLQKKGLVQHRENPFRDTDLKPQHAALQAAEDEPVIRDADWAICMDVDEFISIHTGDGTLDALYDAVGQANLISMTWRLFGNSDVHDYDDRFVIEQFTRCAPEFARKPHQAWGFKTLFRNLGIFKKLGVHRPKGLKPQRWEEIHWVNGSGREMPTQMFRNAWRSTAETYGYDLVTLNHYAVRSAESFLVKRDRGRVNHVDRDQGLAYWFRMNNNAEEDRSIQRMLPPAKAEFDRLMADPDIRAAHEHSVAMHRAKIAELRATENYETFYGELCSPRMEKLSRMHQNFGANVFLAGPETVPDEVIAKDPADGFFFTVERVETAH